MFHFGSLLISPSVNMVLFLSFFFSSETVNSCTCGKIDCCMTHVQKLMVYEKNDGNNHILTDEDMNKEPKWNQKNL
jgi:hypothetical protein